MQTDDQPTSADEPACVLDRPVGRPLPERADHALLEAARRLLEAPQGTPIPVPREAVAAADAPLREALASELATIRRRERKGCFECAWGRVCGCWRCGGRR